MARSMESVLQTTTTGVLKLTDQAAQRYAAWRQRSDNGQGNGASESPAEPGQAGTAPDTGAADSAQLSADAAEQTRTRKIAKRVMETYTSLRGRVMTNGADAAAEDQLLAEPFVQWVAGAAPHGDAKNPPARRPELQGMASWASNLAGDERQAFYAEVRAFCETFNFELEWLIDPQGLGDPKIRRDLEEVVLLYCVAYWRAIQARPLTNAFAAFHAWRLDPLSEENRALTQQLFAGLVEPGQQAAAPLPDLLFSEEQRQSYIVQSINEAAARNFLAVIAIILKQTDEGSGAEQKA